jgi:hypothetical protein
MGKGQGYEVNIGPSAIGSLLAFLNRDLPPSSLLISHVVHSPTPPLFSYCCFFDWQLSLLLPAHAGSSLADFSTVNMETIRFSETSVNFTGYTGRHIPEDVILHYKTF